MLVMVGGIGAMETPLRLALDGSMKKFEIKYFINSCRRVSASIITVWGKIEEILTFHFDRILAIE
jgi:hypothetical protein